MADLQGICTPICTIFSEDGSRIDEVAQKKHLDRLLDAGIHVIAVCGGTGEFSFLSREERLKLTELVARHIDGRAKLIVHASAVMTEETIDYAKHAEGQGADCLLVLPPYFEGPTLAGSYEHYEKVANSVKIDLMAYNIPVHSGIDLEPEFVQRLMEIDNIRYLKDSTGDFLRIQQLLTGGIRLFNGADPLMFHGLMANAVGCFWGTSNAIPELAVKLYSLCQQKQWEQARILWQKIYALNDFIWHNPFNPSVKALGNLLGHDLRQCRRPVQPLTEDEASRLSQLVADFSG
ncbi:MAG: dihydrodipicolinate synthase family protein [Gammaproteobacteria bacterium]|nr:dihydrodipicolinate synthase family protein [Gammaproteobacteria bacterium]